MSLNLCKPLLFILLFILFISYATYNSSPDVQSNSLSLYQIAIRNNNNNKVSIIYDGLYITKKLNITLKYKINNNYNNNINNNNNNHPITSHYFNKNQPISLLLAKEIISNNNYGIAPSFPCYALEVRDALLKELNSVNINGYQRVEIFINVKYENEPGSYFILLFNFILITLNNFLKLLFK